MDNNVRVIDDREGEIDLIELLFVLKSKLWLLVLGLLVGVIISGVYTVKMVSPTYYSESTIMMRGNTNITTLQDITLGSALSNSYIELFRSRTNMTKAIDELGLDMSWRQLRSLVSISNDADMRILKVSVTYTDPQVACDIVNKVVELGMAMAREIDTKEPYLVDAAIVEGNPVGPNLSKNLVIGALLGVVIVAAIIIITFLIDDRIHHADDVERYLRLAVLCEIPESESADYSSNRKNSNKSSK